ncbi:MAG: transporter substrate-binding domain-containing protein [Candidatus Cyclobacteriaceae bacterium M2_1C_046]
MSIKILVLLLFPTTLLFAQEQSTQDTIIVGIKVTPPFIIEEGNEKYTGISVQLWENIASELNATYRYKSYDLQGLQEALLDNEIDLSINPLTVTSERVKAYNFTQPYFITSLAIATTKSGQNKWIAFIRNFFSIQFFEVIIVLFIVLMIFGILVWLFERKQNPDQFGKGWKGMWSGLWWSAVTMTTVGYGDKAPVTTGGRIVALVWMFTAIIIISGFTASIASALTVSSLEVSIKGPKDLENFDVAAVEGSTGDKYLEKSNIARQSVASLDEALKMLNNEEIDAVVYDEPLLRYLINNEQYAKDLMILEPRFATQYYSFALPKNSELRDRINPILLQEINSEAWGFILQQYELER